MKKTHLCIGLVILVVISVVISKVLSPDHQITPHSEEMSVQVVPSETAPAPLTTSSSSDMHDVSTTTSVVLEETISIPAEVPTATLPSFTKESLAKYDGEDPQLPIYIALEGQVYDVTAGEKFYGPGGSYHFLAGTDGTLLLKAFGGNIIKQKYPVIGTYSE